MVAVTADHLPPDIIKAPDKRRVGIVELPAGDTFDNQQTILVASIQKSRISRIMGGADGIITATLQVDHIPGLHRVGDCISYVCISLVTVSPAHIQFLPVDKETFFRCITDRTDTDLFICFIQHSISG